MWKKRDETITTIEQARLAKLGISSMEVLEQWKKKGDEDAYSLPGFEKFKEILYRYVNGPIYIIGDYDVDGITATAIFLWTLHWLGFKNFRFMIPHRCRDGYGMKKEMVDRIKEANALIITFDNGIAAHEAIRYAKEKGHTVICTDHHEPVKTDDTVMIPRADLVMDPMVIPGTWDFDGYCGAGIAYKIARKLLREMKGRHLLLLPLAAIGTLCDQMMIREENYYIVRTGLAALNRFDDETKYKNYILPGIRAVKKAMRINVWNSYAALFQAGPAINAQEKMNDGGASTPVSLFLEPNPYNCALLAEKLVEVNDQRKAVVADVMEHYGKEPERGSDGRILYPIIEVVDNCPEGIAGIIAGKLLEKYQVPVGIFTRSADAEVLKGSFRSPEGFHIMNLLNECREMFEACGGHAAAAGASVKKENFEKMKQMLRDKAPKGLDFKKEDLYDIEINNKDIVSAIMENRKAEPFGNGNEDLIFKIRGFVPMKMYGEWKKEIKGNGIKIRSEFSDAIGFNIPDMVDITGPEPLTLYGNISFNVFNGKTTPQIMMLGVEKDNR